MKELLASRPEKRAWGQAGTNLDHLPKQAWACGSSASRPSPPTPAANERNKTRSDHLWLSASAEQWNVFSWRQHTAARAHTHHCDRVSVSIKVLNNLCSKSTSPQKQKAEKTKQQNRKASVRQPRKHTQQTDTNTNKHKHKHRHSKTDTHTKKKTDTHTHTHKYTPPLLLDQWAGQCLIDKTQ